MRGILFSISLLVLAACGGGGSGGNRQASTASAMMNMQLPTTNGAVILKAPVLSFNDSGFSVSDGITRFGRWAVDSEIEWEFSLNQGASWTRGVGASFEVTGDGAKMIWVRARDDAGNTSEIVRVNCVLDTMAPAAVTIAPQLDGVTNTLKLSGIEPGASWEYSIDQQRTWLPGKGVGLGVLGNNLSSIWLRQVDLAGNASAAQSFDLRNQSMVAHEASGVALQPSVLAQGLQTYLIHGVVVRGDADYVRWDIPKGQQLQSVKLVQYVSDDAIAFYALQAAKVFDAGQDVSRMLVYGHMGPGDLGRNVVADLPKSKLGEGAMTLWFQQTGSLPTQYAIEVITAIESSTTSSSVAGKAVDLTDAIAILKMIVGLDVNASGTPLTAYQAYAADVDGNGKVELSDAISVLKRIVGLEAATANWMFFNGTPTVADKLNPGLPPSVSAAVGNAPNVSMTAVLRGDVVSSSAYTYNWALASKPAGSNAAITDTNAVNPSFKADVAGDYVATVTITDGSMNVSTSSVTLQACHAGSLTSNPLAVCDSKTQSASNLLSKPVVANQVTVSTNVNANAYPTLYAAVASSPVIDDACLLTSSSISYPESYKGVFQLPQVSGSFAKTNVALSITPKDDWVNSVIGGSNPNMNTGCLTTHKEAFISTLVRLKALGTKYLTINSSTRLDDAANPTKLTGHFISNSDLLWMGQKATENGMKLRFTMLVDIWDIKGNNLYDALNKLNTAQQLAWGKNFLRLYNEMMLNEASVMATMPNHFDAIKLDWGYFDPAIFNENRPVVIASIAELSQSIRKIHNWKQWIANMTVTNYNVPPSNLNPGSDLLINSVDLIEMMPQNPRPITQQEDNNLSATFVKNFYNIVPNWLVTTKKPIIWNIQVQSHRAFFTKGWIEDCCITTGYTGAVADFSVQAIGIEGMLQMISEKTKNGDVVTDSVNFTSYWWTDTMKPYQSLPEISQSIRNKPAEALVYQWWKQ